MKFKKQFLFLLLLAVVITPRLPGLDSFVAVDEPAWLTRGGNFYYALGQREFQNTVYEYHPSVTTMWFVTGALLIYFPEYRGLGQGYFDVDKEKFDPYLLEHGRQPIELLHLSRLFQIAVISLFALLIFYFLSLLFGDEPAFFVTALITCAPFFLGHSRVLSHEGMVAFFVLASILGMVAYLEHDRKWLYLVISAAAAALAQLTKSSAMAMLPVIGLILGISLLEHRKTRGFFHALFDHIKVFLLWAVMLIIVYVLVWPGMWVAPGKMLYEVYGNAFSYALQGARLTVTEELLPANFGLASAGETIGLYLGELLWRSTPIMWLGLVFAVLVLLQRDRQEKADAFRKLVLLLFVNALMFILLFSLAQGRNAQHYIMASHVSLDAIAALGWVKAIEWPTQKWKTTSTQIVQLAMGTGVIALQLASATPFYPYYYNYSNPLMVIFTGHTLRSDYGEGFEQAAAYLARKPEAASLRALSFRGRGPFSFFFPGETIILNPLFMEEPGMASMVERLNRADYLIFNDAMAARTPRSRLFVDALDGIRPEQTIRIYGIYDIHVYRVADLPPAFFETISR